MSKEGEKHAMLAAKPDMGDESPKSKKLLKSRSRFTIRAGSSCRSYAAAEPLPPSEGHA